MIVYLGAMQMNKCFEKVDGTYFKAPACKTSTSTFLVNLMRTVVVFVDKKQMQEGGKVMKIGCAKVDSVTKVIAAAVPPFVEWAFANKDKSDKSAVPSKDSIGDLVLAFNEIAGDCSA